MYRIILSLLSLTAVLFASGSGEAVLAKKGEKIIKTLCESSKLPPPQESMEVLMQKIKASKACPPLSKNKLKAVAFYLKEGSSESHSSHIAVPKDAKCPVCGMFVSKYPKWTTMMEHDGKRYYFDGVKDMMKYYIFDGDFVYDRTHITQMKVSDYYTLEAIPAKEAFYVLDSDVFGPMGRELIPFKNLKSAEDFSADHNGRSIVKFDEITDSMLMKLDGLIQ